MKRSVAAATLLLLLVGTLYKSVPADCRELPLQERPPPRRIPSMKTAGRCKNETQALIDLAPCFPAVSPHHPSDPSEECCTVVDSLSHRCVCYLLTASPLPYIDRDRALRLHSLCHFTSVPLPNSIEV